MFNRKKTKASDLRRIVEETRAELIKVNGQCAHYRQQTDALRIERDELRESNSQLKHDLETEIRQKQELSDMLTQRTCSGCVRAGRYHSKCASCIRNPHAVDKYQKEADNGV